MGIVPVATDHMQINCAFSVPNLVGWFSGTSKVTSAFVIFDHVEPGIHCTIFLVMCLQFHPLLPAKGLDTCELLIFCKGVFGDAFNLVTPNI